MRVYFNVRIPSFPVGDVSLTLATRSICPEFLLGDFFMYKKTESFVLSVFVYASFFTLPSASLLHTKPSIRKKYGVEVTELILNTDCTR